jgi:hypothetical protein
VARLKALRPDLRVEFVPAPEPPTEETTFPE